MAAHEHSALLLNCIFILCSTGFTEHVLDKKNGIYSTRQLDWLASKNTITWKYAQMWNINLHWSQFNWRIYTFVNGQLAYANDLVNEDVRGKRLLFNLWN